MVQIKNMLFQSTIQLDASNAIVASNVGTGVDVTIQWVDPAARTATLYISSAKLFITINATNKVVAGVTSQQFKLVSLGNDGSNSAQIIKAVGAPANVLVLDKAIAPVTNAPAPASGAADDNKQYWYLV